MTYTLIKDRSYGSNAEQKCDVYAQPLNSGAPAVVVFHGGGWDAGDKTDMGGDCKAFANRGIVVFNCNYQLDPARPWLAQPSDARKAFGWAVTNAASYGADPDRFAVLGSSAGAVLALLKAFQWAQQLPAGKPVKAAVGWSSPTDLAAMLIAAGYDTTPAPYGDVLGQAGYPSNKIQEFLGWCTLQASYPSPEPSQPMLDPCAGMICAQRYADVSPLQQATADTPAVMLAHFTNDEVVPYTQSDALATALASLGVTVSRYSPAGATPPYHDMTIDAATVAATGDFLLANL